MSKDKNYTQLIHTARWVKLRAVKLTRSPLCEICQQHGMITQATEVHHITPVEDGLSRNDMIRLMFNPTNLLSLCHSCHKQIHREIGACSKEGVRERTRKGVEEFQRLFPS